MCNFVTKLFSIEKGEKHKINITEPEENGNYYQESKTCYSILAVMLLLAASAPGPAPGFFLLAGEIKRFVVEQIGIEIYCLLTNIFIVNTGSEWKPNLHQSLSKCGGNVTVTNTVEPRYSDMPREQ